MNPSGPSVSFPTTLNDNYTDDPENTTSTIYGAWQVVYSWPPNPTPPPPRRVTFEKPSILQGTLFKCHCKIQVARTYPIVVNEDDKSEVKGCELTTEEVEVPGGLNRTTCPCKTTPYYEKIVVQTFPTNDNQILMYQRHKHVQYTPEFPHSCLLMVKKLPSNFKIENAVTGMDIAMMEGDYTFQVQQ
ncbi:uncharacterized protein LOC134753215 [Cydia strobilella]|uniref:uncharacterized protein LOC134753215 n=1 Tax=Cydia strobilella TaxID=1100964 RepID=UPI003004779B